MEVVKKTLESAQRFLSGSSRSASAEADGERDIRAAPDLAAVTFTNELIQLAAAGGPPASIAAPTAISFGRKTAASSSSSSANRGRSPTVRNLSSLDEEGFICTPVEKEPSRFSATSGILQISGQDESSCGAADRATLDLWYQDIIDVTPSSSAYDDYDDDSFGKEKSSPSKPGSPFRYYNEEENTDGNFSPTNRLSAFGSGTTGANAGRVVSLRSSGRTSTSAQQFGSGASNLLNQHSRLSTNVLGGSGSSVKINTTHRPSTTNSALRNADAANANNLLHSKSNPNSPTISSTKRTNKMFDPFEDLTTYNLDKNKGTPVSNRSTLTPGSNRTGRTSSGNFSTTTSLFHTTSTASSRHLERVSLGDSSNSPSPTASPVGRTKISSSLSTANKLNASLNSTSASGTGSSASSSSGRDEVVRRSNKTRLSYEEMQQQMEEGCALSRFYAAEITDRPDEAPHEPLVEYYNENLEVVPKAIYDKQTGQKFQQPPYKIKILTVEIVPSSILEGNCTPSPKVNGRTKSTSPTRTKTAFQGVIESEFGAEKVKKFFLKLKPSKYAGNGPQSFHTNNDSSMAVWWHKKLTGNVPKVRDDLVCPEIPILGSNPLGTLAHLGQPGNTQINLSQLQNTNPLGIPRAKLSALAKHEAVVPVGAPNKSPHIGIATLFRGMIVPNALETYQQPGTFGNSKDPRSISEQANMTSPLHGIPKIKVPVCCKRKLCSDKEFHLRQMMINLQSVLQLIYDFTGYAFDFMIDNTLAFCACSTTREKEEGVSYPMIMINLQRIPNKFAVLAHIVGHEYGHIMRGHLQQQCRCQFGPSSWQHKMLEYEADQFSALFIATMNIDPREIYHHLANDEVRLQQLKHFVNTFSTYGDRNEGANSMQYGSSTSGGSSGAPSSADSSSSATGMQRLYKMFT
ncbi:unnamed protein product [Amoebophrya sp. A120]|nr:unnamed protein product [Amoebophrya sp. A120]|eukprot:GSA120T00003908001.1